jgi:ribosomal protein L40E
LTIFGAIGGFIFIISSGSGSGIGILIYVLGGAVVGFIFACAMWGIPEKVKLHEHGERVDEHSTTSPQPLASASVQKKYCRYCGAENKSDAAFCEKCGKQIS